MATRMRLESGFLRRRPLFWIALSCCFGIVLDATFAPPLLALAIFFSFALLTALLTIIRFQRGAFAAGLVLALVLGSLTHAVQFRIRPVGAVSRLTPEGPSVVWLRGRIIEREWRSNRDARDPFPRVTWTLALEALGGDAAAMQPASGRIRVSVKSTGHADSTDNADDISNPPLNEARLAASAAEGDRVEFRATLEPLPIATLPDSFDYGSYLAGLNVQRVGIVAAGTFRKLSTPEWWRIGLRLRRFSGELASRTLTLLNGHAEQAGLLNAMVFGRRESLSVSDREAFAVSGTAHLLAISGLHIQLLCAAFWRVLGCFGISRRKSAIGVFAACLAYCLLTGSSPPAVRATVMFGAYVAAFFFQREADPLSALGAAALIVLSYAPHDLFSAGFQLSFLAVLSLHTLLPLFENVWEAWRVLHARPLVLAVGQALPITEQVKRWIMKSMLVTLSAWLATAPPVAWHMGRFSTLGLFVNLFALPFLSVCMAAGTATILAGYFWLALGQVLGWGAWLSLALLEWVNAFCAHLPGASIDMPRPMAWTLVAYASLLTWLWISHRQNVRVLRVCGVAAACPMILLSNAFFFRAPALPELTILDLQRGRAALIETRDGAALIDTGGGGQGYRIVELLRRRRIQTLSLLVITADLPGEIDGALEIIPRVRPQRVILPRCKFPSETRRALETLLTEQNIPYDSPPAAGGVAAPDGVRWEFSDDGPPPDKPAANGSTLCVRVDLGAFSALFADAKSSASLVRLLSKKDQNLSASVLRITPGEYGKWPRETNELIRRAGSHVIITGASMAARETAGVDFDGLDAEVLSPHRDGSVRIRTSRSGVLAIQVYRGGWHDVTSE